ncbi:G5 domain-containing protein [Paractinoplanes atraurantiacus]|uniref:G5 domain-containing protein n=1 Tax=Paractinoplanes atraurantiacus TaxID=1036182 RepID=A0A285F7S5_9ACTN|nr:G5 domain-containing protein [Actinoplanes atraurantiacus]SNY06271.1 G5 domain-containing protein [Actinoplanes atraurantiacus]
MPRKSWWARLPFGVRMAAGGGALLVVTSAAVGGVAALTKDDPAAPRIVTAVGQAAASTAAEDPETPAPVAPQHAKPQYDAAAALPRIDDQADRTATRMPRQAPAQAAVPPVKQQQQRPAPQQQAPQQQQQQQPQPPVVAAGDPRPVLTTRTETETREIPFQTRLVRDPSLPRGARKIQTAGVPGEETLRYLVTFTDGKQTERRLLDSTITKQPQSRVIAFGSRRGPMNNHPPKGCDDFCLPLGRSADCRQESAVQLGGSVTILDQDIALLDAESLGNLGCGPKWAPTK